MNSLHGRSFNRRGAALIITLAFIVLLTGLVFAYFSRATTDRQVSNASLNNTAADLLARSALDIVIGDFKQEIANTATITSTNILPARSGNPSFNPNSGGNVPADPIPNLIRRSVRSDTLVSPAVASRASAVNSETDLSPNGRSISKTRWNNHYLIGSANLGSFTSPDWVLMTRSGPVPFASWDSSVKDKTSNNYVVGRYGYAVYDEGGLLDINVAGYPYPSPTPGGSGSTPSLTDIGRKGVITFADLSGVASTNSDTTIMSPLAVNNFVLFRNYATTESAQKLNDPIAFSGSSICNTVLGGHGFLNYYLGADGTQGCSDSTKKGTTVDFGQVNKIVSTTVTPRTDQAFMTRQELIKFQDRVGVASTNALQYLGTFSREQNKPTWKAQGSTLVFPNRFYLGNLARVVPNPPPPDDQKVGNFNLHWNGTYWEYWGTGTSIANAIPKITDPSTADFFQLLNHILHPPASGLPWDTSTADSNNIATTLALGAALIDQYDADSNTTRIDYSNGSVYGMEQGAAADLARPGAAPSPPAGYYSLNRPFRNVAELGYAFKQWSTRLDQTLDFCTRPTTSFPVVFGASLDAGFLDLFTYNSATVRSGIVNLNTRQAPVLTAILTNAITAESTASTLGRGTTTLAAGAANTIVNTTETSSGSSANAAIGRADAARLASLATGSPFTTNDEGRETIARALAEVGQTRTWGLLIDLVAQTGHYASNATELKNFVVDGEKRYWLHVAIDRFDGTIVGQQLEEVLE
jgi:hypothetical protein